MNSHSDSEPRRRSTREIKRRRFDDEVYEQIDLKPNAKKPKLEKTTSPTPQFASPAPPQISPSATVTSPATTTPSASPAKSLPSPAKSQPMASVGLRRSRPPPPPLEEPVKLENEKPPPVVIKLAIPQRTSNRGMPPSTPVNNTANNAPAAKSASSKRKRETKKEKPPEAPKPGLPDMAAAVQDIGRWQPTDDLARITAVMQTNDLKAVYTGITFTCKFTLEDIERRWYALLYDVSISKLAKDAMKEMPPELVLAVQAKTLFSKAEEKLLASIPSTSEGALEQFQQLIDQHADTFYFARNAKVLQIYWNHMKEFRLLDDQRARPLPRLDYGLTFSEMEAALEAKALTEPCGANEEELLAKHRAIRAHEKKLSKEIVPWNAVVESITGISQAEFDPRTFAILRGRCVRYKVKSDAVTLGRATKDCRPDIDVSLDGPAFKISRRQAKIKMRKPGDFVIMNDGPTTIFVDGNPVLRGCLSQLHKNSSIEMAGLRFTFLINEAKMAAMQQSEGASTSSQGITK